MNKYTINEGTIQVPQRLINEALEEVKNFYIRFIYDFIPDRFAFEQLTYNGEPLPVPPSDYRLLGIKSDEYVITEIEYNHSEIKYSDETGNTHFKLAVSNKDKGKTLGGYSVQNNVVVVFIHRFTEMLKEQSVVFDENYFNASNEEKIEILDIFDVQHDIERYINEFLKKVKSTIHHELVHMIQYQYLKDKDEKQVSGSSDTVKDYLTSQVEYSPHIVAAIEDYETFVTDIDKKGIPEYRKDVLKIMTGITQRTLIYYDDYSGEPPKSVSESMYRSSYISPNRTFFDMLKKHEPKQYKKAVKYMYNEIKKRGLI